MKITSLQVELAGRTRPKPANITPESGVKLPIEDLKEFSIPLFYASDTLSDIAIKSIIIVNFATLDFQVVSESVDSRPTSL